MPKHKCNNIIGTKELRENLPAYIEEVGKGKSFTVVRRSKPVFEIKPLAEDNSRWETVVDFTRIKKGGVKIDDILSRI